MAAAAVLNFQKFEILMVFSLWGEGGGQKASSCQISSKSVKRLQIYGDLTVFKMAAVRRKFLTVGAVKRTILQQPTKFRKDRSKRCGDIAIFL